MQICGSGDSRHSTSSGLSPGGKVVSLFRRDCGVVFSLSSTRANMEGNPGALGSGDVSSTLDMVLQVRCTGVRALAGWNICDGAVRTAGPWEEGIFLLFVVSQLRPLGGPTLALA